MKQLPDAIQDPRFHQDPLKHYGAILARIAFVVYFFFIIFGTSVPFRSRPMSIDDFSSSNVVNQIVFSTLFMISIPCMIVFWRECLAFFKKEKWLILFLIWATLSIGWSNFPFVSFKRLFQIYTNVTICLTFLVSQDDTQQTYKYIRPLLMVYLPLNLLSVFIIPGAIDPTHGTWRGMAVGKNFFGQEMLVSAIFMFFSARSSIGWNRIIDFGLCCIAVVLLLGSRSGTAIGTFGVVICLALLYYANSIFKSLKIGRIFIYFILLSFTIFAVIVYFMAFDWIEQLFQAAGKNLSFTGRTLLWQDIWAIAKSHFWLGCGFDGFWVMSHHNYALMAFLEYYEWVPNEAHMGYLDVLNEVGMIGLLLFVAMMVRYFIRIPKDEKEPYHYWIMIAILVINLQETTLFRANIFTGVVVILGYMDLNANLLRRERIRKRLPAET